jgi:hypothetical protein
MFIARLLLSRILLPTYTYVLEDMTMDPFTEVYVTRDESFSYN